MKTHEDNEINSGNGGSGCRRIGNVRINCNRKTVSAGAFPTRTRGLILFLNPISSRRALRFPFLLKVLIRWKTHRV